MKPLAAKGYTSLLQIESEQSDERTAESQSHDLIKQRHGLMQQASELSAQRSQLPLTRDEKINDLSRQLLQLQQSLVNGEASRLSVISAPLDEVVSSEVVREGQNVTTGTLLLSIVPKGSPLQALLLVPSSSIGFAHVGTDMALHFQVFPYQKFGIQHGQVTVVSRSALSPNEVTALMGQSCV
jgi:membrane fusion protein